MNEEPRKTIKPWWMLIALWGIDVPLVALSWGVLIAALFGIPLLTFGPLLLLISMVWVYVLFTRVVRALAGEPVPYEDYYRGHAFLMLLVALCAFFASQWLLFFSVGKYLIAFFAVPFLVVLLTHVPILKKVPFARELGMGAAFVFSCAVPTYFYSYLYSPLHMFFNTHLWCLIVLFLLFMVERSRPTQGQEGGIASTWLPGGMIVFFVACFYMVLTTDNSSYEHHFYGTLCIATAFLHVMSKMRQRVNEAVWFSFCWGLMAVPALLGILLYAPETWLR